MPTLTQRKSSTQRESSRRTPTAEQQVYQTVQRQLESCSYSYYFCKVTYDFEEGRLVLRGCVPTFYLKQMLQELLRGIKYVTQIRNEVDVVNSNGLSSVR